LALLDKVAMLVRRSNVANFAYLLARDGLTYYKFRKKGAFSQHGEEEFLSAYFQGQETGTYVDIGCSHPFRISNTYGLYRKGWSGVAVDPIPVFGKLFRLWRPRDVFLNVGVGPENGDLTYFELIPSVLSTFDEATKNDLLAKHEAVLAKKYVMPVVTPNSVFEKYMSHGKIDFLSIDVESLDFTILKAIDFSKHRPKLIAIEFNTEEDRLATLGHLEAVGYHLKATLGCNLMAEDKRQTARVP
jgi:hypothetical protein